MMKKIVIVIIWITVMAGLIAYLLGHSGEVRKILTISAIDISLLILLFVATQFINGLRTMILLKKLGVELGLRECFHLSNLTTMANYLPFKGGTIATAVYFKNKHSIPYTKFANILIANQLFLLLTIGFVSSFLIYINYLMSGVFLTKLFYFFLLLFICMLPFFFFLKSLVRMEKLFGLKWERLKAVVTGSSIILGDRKLLSRLFGINVFAIIIMGLRFSVAFKILSYNASFILSVLSGQAKTLTTLLNITPAGLGIAEFSAGIVSEMTDSNLNIGIYAASLDRVVSVLTLLFICIVAAAYFYKHKKFNFNQKKGV